MNVAQLITSVRSWGSIPNLPTRFGDTELINYLNAVLRHKIVPLIMSTNEEHFRTSIWLPADTQEIPIPTDAVAGALRDITIWNSEKTICLYSLNIINPDNLPSYDYGFYLRDNSLIIYPTYNQNGLINVAYIKRRNELTDNYGTVVTSAPSAGTTTVETQYTFSISAGDLIEFINPNAPFQSYGTFTVATVTAGTVLTPTVITFLDADATALPVGSYITKGGYTYVPQIPLEAHDLLAQGTVVKYLEALGDATGLGSAAAVYAEMEKNLLKMLTPRIKGETLKIVSQTGIDNYL